MQTRIPSRALSSAAVTLVAAAVLAAAAPALAQPVPAPQVAARAWMLTDVTSGQVLGGGNVDERIEPASLTKLMTAYLAVEAVRDGKLKYDQMLTPTETVRSVKTDESRMFLQPGKPVSVRDLLQGLIVQSGNDAALVLAEAVGGTETNFVMLMNREAERLGMKGTHFMNAAGLPDPNHYTTARDLSILTAALIRDFPEDYKFYSQKEFTYNNIKQPNRNRLLWIDPTVDGVKTGHTKSAGYCLITSAKRPLPDMPNASRRLLSVMIGTKSEQVRTQESLKVLNYGYQFFDTLRLYEAKQALQTPDVYKGQAKTVKLGVAEDKWITVPKGSGGRLKPVLERKEPLIAPIVQGQQLGTVKVMDGATVVQEFPVVALEAVPEAGFIGRTIDSIKLWFKKK
ncbi:D-alanyl-D-alanine carboxypeptidase family protein [Ralstonia sp. SM1864_UCD524_TZ4]|uniref:serine-type D-Ala-D-Ala carboxypeptidase n=1 Tax=Ralstonia solanacearum TaxID=305 RepID=A0A0S4VW40_RALSL|nr:D-alanyl-D-alanine carboxypeptidase family protein [Ralstonia pseudosolanacearum]CUV22047.1 D-alanyl-D-alanine carboxypeptidase DacC [Ralstonia solanacearum]CUV32980.1 D-alanyl-D-alanine carboxypeptidase DacC [Ralstonia solanacearum]CUV38792.1 D-alanyl-D-alanine carboxypeptidase DacC [Ralstonia solanacearum]CUV59694.1 D-alanyl-D-alanine carboxypeptidase DacC [Ralstonia solanacearum]